MKIKKAQTLVSEAGLLKVGVRKYYVRTPRAPFLLEKGLQRHVGKEGLVFLVMMTRRLAAAGRVVN